MKERKKERGERKEGIKEKIERAEVAEVNKLHTGEENTSTIVCCHLHSCQYSC